MNSKTDQVAFIGLGVMGGPMAGHLAAKSGASVAVYNRTRSRADVWAEKNKGWIAATPAEAAAQSDIVFTCVGNDDDLRAVLTGPQGVVQTIKPGSMIVDHTTASADVAREMFTLFADKNCTFLDAPVSGGQAGAEKGQLTVMVGGEKRAYERLEPMLRACYAREVRHIGPAGSGQLAKMVNQICIAGVVQGLAEGLAFGMKAGLEMNQVVAAISKGSAQSWQLENRAATMIEGRFDFGFALDWMIKDLGIALDEAVRNGAKLEVTKIIRGYYQELQKSGHGRLDTSSLIKRLS